MGLLVSERGVRYAVRVGGDSLLCEESRLTADLRSVHVLDEPCRLGREHPGAFCVYARTRDVAVVEEMAQAIEVLLLELGA